MKHPVVIGLQYGDEGKGKVTDLLAKQASWVIRFNGGNNAGHTLYLNGQKVVTHSVPSGVLYDKVNNFIGAACVINAQSLREEIEEIEKTGVKLLPNRLKIDYRAHLILPIHLAIDASRESSDQKIGSTKRGIGPTYMSKMDRNGIRIGELVKEPDLEKRVRFLCDTFNSRLEGKGLPISSFEENWVEVEKAKAYLEPLVSWDETPFFERSQKEKCLLEGAQGVLLDLDHGSYPYVTSSNTVGAQASIGTPFPMRQIGNIFGIAKAYLTRVGEGPMPSQLDGELAEKLREAGGEYGATTGRPRRVGWLNLDELRKAVRLSDCNAIVMTKADVLCEFEKVSYFKGGTLFEVAGWSQAVEGDKLHANLEAFVKIAEDYAGVPIVAVGTGAERDAMFWRHKQKDLWELVSVSR